MKRSNSGPPDWNKEYQLFLQSSGHRPPPELSARIKRDIGLELNPSGFAVFRKLFAIHLIAGTSTLLICPQFGFSFHGTSEILHGLFSGLGEAACMVACGAFFLGVTAAASAILLNPSEVRAIRRSKGLQWILLAFISLGFFLSLTEQERAIPTFLLAAWVVGTCLGAGAMFQLVHFFRFKLQSYQGKYEGGHGS